MAWVDIPHGRQPDRAGQRRRRARDLRSGTRRMAAADGRGAGRPGRGDHDDRRGVRQDRATRSGCRSRRCRRFRIRWPTWRSPCRAGGTWRAGPRGSWTTNPTSARSCAGCAFVFMAEEAPKAATMAVHIQGGLGVSAEAAATAYLVRARGWPLAGGDPGATAKRVGRIIADRESRTRKGNEHNGFHTRRTRRRRSGVPRRGPRIPRRAGDRGRHRARPGDRRQLRRGCAPGPRRARAT